MNGSTRLWLGTFRLRPDLLDPGQWSGTDHEAAAAHFERLKQGAREGRVLIAGRTDDKDASGRLNEETMGIVIFEANDRAAASAFLSEDPAVAAGIMKSTVQSYRPATSRESVAHEAGTDTKGTTQ